MRETPKTGRNARRPFIEVSETAGDTARRQRSASYRRGPWAPGWTPDASYYSNVAVRRYGRAYLMWLLSHQERKNSWSLAEFAGDMSPDEMKRLLNFLAVLRSYDRWWHYLAGYAEVPRGRGSHALTRFPLAAMGGRGRGDRDRCHRLLIARQYR